MSGKSETIYGTDGNDVIRAGGGDDNVYAGMGDDVLLGGTGKDRLFGEEGNDTLRGGSTADHLDGGLGDDRLCGGSGDDLLYFYSGHDVVTGGSGQDYFMINGIRPQTPGSTLTITDYEMGEDWLYITDYLEVTGVNSINNGHDTEFVVSDTLHDDNPGSPYSMILRGVSVGEIQEYLEPINGGTSLAPLFTNMFDIPWF
ncbi:calcium-binding protein [Arenibaculum pallidiluteum]|uniref:calcium-binding protein n=1 Tax=Arenibaculum pallidiluteum TaxID=2812559 RepID=UPI001A96CCBF|nr:calcium-binding protein [Arenibaculum pallidiluteum]